jgi:hypothetical protein
MCFDSNSKRAGGGRFRRPDRHERDRIGDGGEQPRPGRSSSVPPVSRAGTLRGRTVDSGRPIGDCTRMRQSVSPSPAPPSPPLVAALAGAGRLRPPRRPPSPSSPELEPKNFVETVSGFTRIDENTKKPSSRLKAKFEMVYVPGRGGHGSGSPEGEVGPGADRGAAAQGRRSATFWMGKCEVTWDEFDVFWFDEHVPQVADDDRRPRNFKPGRRHPARRTRSWTRRTSTAGTATRPSA